MSKFLSSQILFSAFRQLSRLTNKPDKQGQTQFTSILRYVSALDAFGKRYHRDCDVSDTQDKELFISLVGNVVSMGDGYYTSNFYTGFGADDDYKVGSNFYSANVVPKTALQPGEKFKFPTRNDAVFEVQNRKLLIDSIQYEHISTYLHTKALRCAFVVWLLRNHAFSDAVDEVFFNEALKDAIYEAYTPQFRDSIWKNDSFSVCDLTDELDIPIFVKNKPKLIHDDFIALWKPLEVVNDVELNSYSRNLIIFGAPGTGKSYQLNKLGVRTKDNPGGIFPKAHVRRVTFYPDYTYSQFVGSYRPFTKGDKIGYHYIAGPFLKTCIEASTHPYDNYLLIIEELNRANPAAVFGDVFQLLDRDAYGASEYYVSVPMEMAACIKESLDKLDDVEKADIESYFDPDMDFDDFCESMLRDLSLPPNMYIWATMNSADQGVFPMDTAFKRRWDFRYMGINEGEDATLPALGGERLDKHAVSLNGTRIVWNKVRKAINTLLLDCGVNEDKLLGPFFLSPEALSNEPYGDEGKSRFVAAFEDKVLLYLYEDAGKMRRGNIFRDGDATFSDICAAFEDDGIDVFAQDTDKHRDVFADVFAPIEGSDITVQDDED